MSVPKTSTAPKSSIGSTTGAKKPAVKTGGADDSADVKQLQAELQESKLNMDTLEKERDFYFGKLRDIEMLLQANPT